MGKKSRGKREKKEQGLRLPDIFQESIKRDDPTVFLALEAAQGPAWLQMEAGDAFPSRLPYAFAVAMAPKCLAAYVHSSALEVAGWIDGEEEEHRSEMTKRLYDGVLALSVLAAAASSKQKPHPSAEIQKAIGSLLDHLPQEILDVLRQKGHPLILEDWKHVEAERAAAECRLDLERAAGPATAESRIRDLDD